MWLNWNGNMLGRFLYLWRTFIFCIAKTSIISCTSSLTDCVVLKSLIQVTCRSHESRLWWYTQGYMSCRIIPKVSGKSNYTFFFLTSNMHTYIIITHSNTLGYKFNLFFNFACKSLYSYVKWIFPFEIKLDSIHSSPVKTNIQKPLKIMNSF